MKLLNRILKIICNAVSIIVTTVLLATLYCWVQVNIFSADYASIFGYSVFEVITGSMAGTIEIDDYIIVKKEANYKLNDIITFRDGDVLVTHRIVQIRGEEIITRGDANNSDDISINESAIIGRVKKIIPKAGIWRDVLLEPRVLVTILITFILFAIFFSIEEKKYVKITHKGNLDQLGKSQKRIIKANMGVLEDEEKNKNK